MAFADPRVTYTKAFQRYALELSQYMTIQDVADHLGISWDVIKEIQKADLKRRFDRPKLKHLRQIAIDEISMAKGHVYLTIVLDLESGVVVHVGQGKGGDALKDFWIRLRRSGAKIEAVATDMSPAYIDAVTTHLPGARLVFDRFHVIKLYNDKLSELRRAMYRELTDTMQKDVLKGVRWLLLKRPENLDPARKEPQRLEEALRLNAAVGHGLLPQGGTQRDLGTRRRGGRPKPCSWTGSPTPNPSASGCCKTSPRRFACTPWESLPTTITPSPPDRWKAPTTRSKP